MLYTPNGNTTMYNEFPGENNFAVRECFLCATNFFFCDGKSFEGGRTLPCRKGGMESWVWAKRFLWWAILLSDETIHD